MIRNATFSLALVALSGCAPATHTTATPDTERHTPPALAEGEVAATGFITENLTPPIGAREDAEDGVYRDSYGRPFNYAYLGEPLPAFSGTLIDGTRFDSEAIDTWMIIDVWGMWCGDCRADAPNVAALVTAVNQDPELDFLSIHTPASANRTDPEDMFRQYGSVEAYFADKGYSYPTLIDTDASIRDTLKIRWTPSYLLIDPDGIVRGYRTEMSAAGGEPVKDFLREVEEVKSASTT